MMMFAKTFGCCGKVYNLMLADKIESYKETGKFVSVTPAKYKEEYPELRKELWKEMFWSRSFCLLTTGGVTIDIIRNYIETQGERNEHKTQSV